MGSSDRGTTVTTQALAALAALVLIVAGCGTSVSPSPTPAATAAPASPSPSSAAEASPSASQSPVDGRFLGDVELADGRHLRLACAGSGSPTVILDSGFGTGIEGWSRVFSHVAELTHACAYERAGIGGSSPVDGTKTTGDIVDDLRELVATAGIPTPYILVGHSIAGLHLRLMGGLHADELAGLVFVDVSVPDQFEAWLAALPPATPDDPAWLTDLRADLGAGWPPAELAERYDILAGLDDVRAVTSFGDLPIVVLTAGLQTIAPAGDPLGMRLQDVWFDLHEALTSMSSNGRHELVPAARHSIQDDVPDAVIEAIRDLVERARG
jgi:pimeloyl-ACP methyl ester carboxylesterase